VEFSYNHFPLEAELVDCLLTLKPKQLSSNTTKRVPLSITARLSSSSAAQTQAGFFSGLQLACKKLRLLIGLAEKHRKRTFAAKTFASDDIYG